jgi:hypothetical protein
MFMRVNAKCAHQARPPLSLNRGRGSAVGKPWATLNATYLAMLLFGFPVLRIVYRGMMNVIFSLLKGRATSMWA